jgi:hypothetical protein
MQAVTEQRSNSVHVNALVSIARTLVVGENQFNHRVIPVPVTQMRILRLGERLRLTIIEVDIEQNGQEAKQPSKL